MSSQRWSSFLERHQCLAWTELARQAFEEMEDDSSSSSSSLNSSITSGSSMDMSDVDALSGIDIVDLAGRKI
jgi:hypothetical protein